MTGKTILDYGCGGAFLATVFPNSRYIGVDIAERSLEAARKHLGEWRPTKPTYTLHKVPVEFSELGADVLVAQQVMNHMPVRKMFDDFLDNIQRSGIPELLLETIPAQNQDDVTFNSACPNKACKVSFEYLQRKLPAYVLHEHETNGVYRFSRWKRK
jgi:SAM-dependent methyltransferase